MNGRVCAEREDDADEGDDKINFRFAGETDEGKSRHAQITDLGAINGKPEIARRDLTHLD